MEHQGSNLREQALDAYAETREEAERAAAATERANQVSAIRSLKDRIRQQFGLHVEPTEGTITIDGLTFGVDNHYRLLQLHMPCGRCGDQIPYKEMTEGLLGLGAALKNYEEAVAEGSFLCPVCDLRYGQREYISTPSTEEQVVIWLLALIRREIAAMVPA